MTISTNIAYGQMREVSESEIIAAADRTCLGSSAMAARPEYAGRRTRREAIRRTTPAHCHCARYFERCAYSDSG